MRTTRLFQIHLIKNRFINKSALDINDKMQLPSCQHQFSSTPCKQRSVTLDDCFRNIDVICGIIVTVLGTFFIMWGKGYAANEMEAQQCISSASLTPGWLFRSAERWYPHRGCLNDCIKNITCRKCSTRVRRTIVNTLSVKFCCEVNEISPKFCFTYKMHICDYG